MKETANLQTDFAAKLAAQGIKYRIVSVERLNDLSEQIRHTLSEGTTDHNFAKYAGFAYNIKTLEKFPDLTSLIVASKYNPAHKVEFRYRNESKTVFLPPGYAQFINKQTILQQTISEILAESGHRCERIFLPVKMLAVCSSLAKYGRNNISYIPEWGSHHFLGSFLTDFPVETDLWAEPETLTECEDCSACVQNCPTLAIGSDRFRIHAEKCLTFFNRNPGIFPKWIKPEWHNSLVGCLRCQECCPANAAVRSDFQSLPGFSEAETETLLSFDDFNQLPAELQERFAQFGFPELHGFILRNLRALLTRAEATQ